MRFGWGQETRHNFGAYGEGYGHVLLLDLDELIEPVSAGVSLRGAGSHDGVPVSAAIEQAHEAGATVIWAHNDFGLEDIPNWVTRRVHAQNAFDGERRFDVNTARGLIQEMSESMNVLSAKTVFADEAARQDVLDVYRQGIDALRHQVRVKAEDGS